MDILKVPKVVYHIAAMGNWHEVIREQFFLLRRCGLAAALEEIGDTVSITHVGDHLGVIIEEAGKQDIPITIVRSDCNLSHYETFAMIEIERLAKIENIQRPILYFHTKGVSNPGDWSKQMWRKAMNHWVVEKWRENVDILEGGRDAAGMNWWQHGEQHFSGTFWMARPDWIRKLPEFVSYHHSKGLVRYSCELWIGATCCANVHSHGIMDTTVHYGNYDFSWLIPKEPLPEVSITWVTITTTNYSQDAIHLYESFGILGEGHKLIIYNTNLNGPWRGEFKHRFLRQLLPTIDTTHVFLVDADCLFVCRLLPTDFIDINKSFTATRHIGFDNARDKRAVPERLWHRLPHSIPNIYWQSCLWGGKVGAVAQLLDKMKWLEDDERGYDEHGLNIELAWIPDQVHTLPCRYAFPSTFERIPDLEVICRQRAEGAARVIHHNREVHRG